STASIISPPLQLGPHGTKLWNAILSEYCIGDAGGLQLLGEACAARDRAESLAEAIARDGAVVYSRAGVPQSHPAVKDELAARALVIRTPGTAGHHDGSDQADAWASAAGEVLMPTNRRPLQRLRHPAFTPSVLKLFAELEAMPRRRRSEA